MIDLVNLKEIRFESSDLEDLQALAKQLIGQPFQFFRVAYGEELRLHLGNLVNYSRSRTKGRTRGSFIIGSRASSWIVSSATTHTLLASDSIKVVPQDTVRVTRKVDIRQIETGRYIAPGIVVVRATAERLQDGFSLHLVFADGSTAMILPNPETYEYLSQGEQAAKGEVDMEISDWEILTPHSRVLRVGPGERWCYVDSIAKKEK